MKFPTHAVIGTTTGRPLGDIGGIYSVISFLIGRPAFTHEIALYGSRAAAAIKATIPDIPIEADAEHVDGGNYRYCLAGWERQFGPEIELPDSLRDCLADDKNAIQTACEMIGADRVIVERR